MNHLTEPLLTPATLLNTLPLSSKALETVKTARAAARNIIQGTDKRLLVIVGPCSIHDTQAALEYATLLKTAAERLTNELFIIMRVYFEKPRTTVGWKGLIRDPLLDGSFNINNGLTLARKLLLDLAELGVPAGTEFLDSMTPAYLSDLIAWSVIGARTVESQIHRELASALAMPVGFKNNTEGNIKAAIDAVQVAQCPHHFLGINTLGIPSIIKTTGNPNGHIILRGSNTTTNYSVHHIHEAANLLRYANLTPRLMVDCSHGNSMKDYQKQLTVVQALTEQLRTGPSFICGIMLESHLLAGRQELHPKHPLIYGQSITDGCIAWEDTVPLLEKIALAFKHHAIPVT